MEYTKIVEQDINQIIVDAKLDQYVNNIKSNTILITGASGMIGSYLCLTFIRLNELFGTNIRILASVRDQNKLNNVIATNKNVEVIVHDVIDPFSIDEHIDYVIHAASPASPKLMAKQPVETNLANTLGTYNTLKLAEQNNSKGYMFISSREIYGEPNEGQKTFTEDGALGQVNPLIPRNGYAEGKKAAENLCAGYKEEYGLNTKIVRLAHTYGPGMSIYDGRVQADFLRNIMNNENIVLKSDGSSIRTYTYISDAITAMLMVLFNSSDLVYNIADESSVTSIKELAESLIEISPNPDLRLVFDISDIPQKGVASFKTGILSTSKIKKELNWYPRYSIKEGFARTIEHLCEEQIKKDDIDMKKTI